MIAKILLAAAALVATAAVTPAAAQSFEFRYKSYELETQGGRASMNARLDRMIDRYCGADDARSLSARRAAEACRETAMAEVVAKIDNVDFASLER